MPSELKPTELKDNKLNMRIGSKLKARYEAALEKAEITMTEHLTAAIYEFVNFEEKQKGRNNP